MAHILVVDDRASTRESCQDLLTWEGHTVETAANAEEALNKCLSGPYDLFVVDLELPGMNGLELIKHLRATWPEAKILLQSGQDEPINHGADYYRQKGSRTDFSEMVQHLLQDKEAKS